MSRNFPPEHELKAVEIGSVAYLRVRVVNAVKLPFGLTPRKAVAVQVIDAAGKPIDGTHNYVPEEGLISMGEAVAKIRRTMQ